MARLHRAPALRAPSGRLTEWLFITPFTTTQTAEGGNLNAALNAAALAKRPFTIVRTYLEVMIVSDQQAASEIQFGAIGAAVVSSQVRAAGTASVPTPITDLGSDLFFVHQILIASLVIGDVTGMTDEGNHYSIDSKAMRKVDGDQDMVIVTEMSSVGSGITLVVGGRMLILNN